LKKIPTSAKSRRKMKEKKEDKNLYSTIIVHHFTRLTRSPLSRHSLKFPSQPAILGKRIDKKTKESWILGHIGTKEGSFVWGVGGGVWVNQNPNRDVKLWFPKFQLGASEQQASSFIFPTKIGPRTEVKPTVTYQAWPNLLYSHFLDV
jgi:hypothetical protein